MANRESPIGDDPFAALRQPPPPQPRRAVAAEPAAESEIERVHVWLRGDQVTQLDDVVHAIKRSRGGKLDRAKVIRAVLDAAGPMLAKMTEPREGLALITNESELRDALRDLIGGGR